MNGFIFHVVVPFDSEVQTTPEVVFQFCNYRSFAYSILDIITIP